ncbi:hypothetical protein L198_03737 [Cryptococcus wingfieldii CBS 7118]|uniref:Uncharacterized protein n=1 Tax=Cryptococcus wingfieldii CBS 7118 TaxID=1295528 RepID=A0A1E3JCD8_9TREE|nr:hypothetical protein L198_03737 [Cryptococcus wingfieldii CBS 7118]ODN98492.1 hypothetical protein L198_03737 [Cryptococcus wingfieldii CBS 7118]
MYFPAAASLVSLILLPATLGMAIDPHSVHARDLEGRADLTVQPQCNGGSLSAHDCNVALLSLGGGIQGAIQFLRVDATTNSSSSNGCTMTVTAADGGTAIDISKGRLEQAQKAAIDKCGQQAWTVTATGGSTGGNLKIEQSADAGSNAAVTAATSGCSS